MSSPISGFTAIPNPQMLAFMGAQSFIMMYQAGEGWQYGKRKISAMSNEEFNKLTPNMVLEKQAIVLRQALPTIQKSMDDMTPMISTIIAQYGDFIREAIKALPELAANIFQQGGTGTSASITNVRLDASGLATQREGDEHKEHDLAAAIDQENPPGTDLGAAFPVDKTLPPVIDRTKRNALQSIKTKQANLRQNIADIGQHRNLVYRTNILLNNAIKTRKMPVIRNAHAIRRGVTVKQVLAKRVRTIEGYRTLLSLTRKKIDDVLFRLKEITKELFVERQDYFKKYGKYV